MRNWKITIAAVAVAVLVITFIVLRQSDFLLGGTAGAATPSPTSPAMPVPVTKIVKTLSSNFRRHFENYLG